jgi:tellurite resistance protein TerC
VIVTRGIMIGAGSALVASYYWVLYIFGAILVITGIKMLFAKLDDAPDLENNVLVKFLRKHLRVTDELHGQRFFVRQDDGQGRSVLWVTPLFLALLMVEFADVIFAVDSVPAIFAITLDPFIVLTSNIFAILGLRAMYFLLANMKDKFHLLNYGLAIILIFIGTKMLLLDVYKIPVWASLGVVITVLTASMILSLKIPPRGAAAAGEEKK